MTTREKPVEIAVGGRSIAGTLVTPGELVPAMLFVHGWAGNQHQYLTRAREIAALGCVCLTFDLQGHADTEDEHETVTREDNLRDLVAAYDLLARAPSVDKRSIGVVGSSYGGYLAAMLTTLRPVRWLGLRVPALYLDEDWTTPKQKLDKRKIAVYRRGPVRADENRALGACAAFEGDVLIVESEHDDVVPHPTLTNYREAFEQARSLTYRVISGADHALSEPLWQEAYTSILLNWATEMVLGAREQGEAPQAHTAVRPAPMRGPPSPA